jgi:putative hemolysin
LYDLLFFVWQTEEVILSEVNKMNNAYSRPYTQEKDVKLIDLKQYLHHPVQRRLFSIFEHPIEKTLSLNRLHHVYQQVLSNKETQNFFQACLDSLNIAYSISPEDLLKIPTNGSLVIVANHPFGGLDGIVLGSILLQLRQNVKILGSYLLHTVPELRPWVIPVDPFGGKHAKKMNMHPLKEALQWVKEGNALITFPAGEVSHFLLSQRAITDIPWSKHIGAIIRHTRATALPVYFDGRNSSVFQIMGLLNPWFRTVLLPHELVNKRFNPVNVQIGKPILWSMLKEFESNEELINHLRLKTYILQNRSVKKRMIFPPNILKEIGRLREVTFREVGEGTGKALDLDRFDRDYLHLFLWNISVGELVGAYRLGLTDGLLKRFGLNGLYTSGLFHFKSVFLEQLGDAIELGRSFIRPEYQKKHCCLFLLWNGIGRFVADHPHYRILFGPVSISQTYNIVSKHLLVRFLREKCFDTELSRYVKPRKPHRAGRVKGISRKFLDASLRDVDDLSALISEIEKDGKGIPILLRHYLKLNATLVSFNVDKDFSNVLDGLIVVDLVKTEQKLLKRYMGQEAFTRFATYHGLLA